MRRRMKEGKRGKAEMDTGCHTQLPLFHFPPFFKASRAGLLYYIVYLNMDSLSRNRNFTGFKRVFRKKEKNDRHPPLSLSLSSLSIHNTPDNNTTESQTVIFLQSPHQVKQQSLHPLHCEQFASTFESILHSIIDPRRCGSTRWEGFYFEVVQTVPVALTRTHFFHLWVSLIRGSSPPPPPPAPSFSFTTSSLLLLDIITPCLLAAAAAVAPPPPLALPVCTQVHASARRQRRYDTVTVLREGKKLTTTTTTTTTTTKGSCKSLLLQSTLGRKKARKL